MNKNQHMLLGLGQDTQNRNRKDLQQKLMCLVVLRIAIFLEGFPIQ